MSNRSDRLDSIAINGKKNSMWRWYKVRNPLRILINFLIIEICKYFPSLKVRIFLCKLLGMNIGEDVSIGLGVQFDIFFPDKITIDNNSIIGYNTTILCHEFLMDEYKVGETKIGKEVMIGADSTILAGVRIGNESKVGAGSVIVKDVPDGEFYSGVPAEKVDEEKS